MNNMWPEGTVICGTADAPPSTYALGLKRGVVDHTLQFAGNSYYAVKVVDHVYRGYIGRIVYVNLQYADLIREDASISNTISTLFGGV